MPSTEELIEIVKTAIEKPCKHDHSIHKQEETDGYRYLIKCGDKELDTIFFPRSSYDISLELSYWKHRVVEEHNLTLIPEIAVKAILKAQNDEDN